MESATPPGARRVCARAEFDTQPSAVARSHREKNAGRARDTFWLRNVHRMGL